MPVKHDFYKLKQNKEKILRYATCLNAHTQKIIEKNKKLR